MNQNFLSLTNAGLEIASFTEIRGYLIERFKSIYGSDIDFSTGTADGVLVNDLSLIINNILQTISSLYNNLDVNKATGVYLDSLCALSNVSRRQANASYAYLTLTYTGDTSRDFSPLDLSFVDKSGEIWSSKEGVSFDPNTSKVIMVTCNKKGKIQAPVGWIYSPVDTTLPLVVNQEEKAIEGEERETDFELKSRLVKSQASLGISTTDGLVGALMNITGIQDVYVYSNNSSEDSDALADGTEVGAHSVYVVIRPKKGITVEDALIGNTIYERLTPGIPTQETAASSPDINKSYDYITEVRGIRQSIATQTVYWKEASGYADRLTITFTPESFFTTDEFSKIANNIMRYANNLGIGETFTQNQLMAQSIYADPRFKGIPTYKVVSTTITGESVNPLRYYNYNSWGVKCSGTVYKGAQSQATITNGQFTLDNHTFEVFNNCIWETGDNPIIIPVINGSFVYNNETYDIKNLTYQKTGDNYILKIRGTNNV